jgi:protein-disulfide isomerase
MQRRDLLVIGALFTVAIAIPPVLRRRASDVGFEDLAGFPGFRRVSGGPVSYGSDLFIGLDTPQGAAAPPRVPSNLCATIFGDPDWSVDPLPIAVFSDYYCPYCATLDRRLDLMRRDGLPIRLVFHELPLLGERSRWAARVALAAKRQTDHAAVHLDMMQRVLRPGLAGLRDVAERHNLDVERLAADAQSASVGAEIDATLALARTLGIPGTPGTFIGRTLVLGQLPEDRITRMVAQERKEPFVGCT